MADPRQANLRPSLAITHGTDRIHSSFHEKTVAVKPDTGIVKEGSYVAAILKAECKPSDDNVADNYLWVKAKGVSSWRVPYFSPVLLVLIPTFPY